MPLSDPVAAQEKGVEILRLYSDAPTKEKEKIKLVLKRAARKAQASNHTFVAATYRQVFNKLNAEGR